MKRIKLTFPPQHHFETRIKVQVRDINYGQHVGHDSFVSLLHTARVEYLSSLGVSELDFGGLGLVMTDLQVQYLRPAFLGDVLTVQIATEKIPPGQILFYSQILKQGEAKEQQQKSKVILKAIMSMVFYDNQTQKMAKAPDAWEMLK